MSYKYPDCATCTSAEIEEWIKNVEYQLQKNIELDSPKKTIEMFQKQLDDLRADLILKQQEEANVFKAKQDKSEAKKQIEDLIRQLLAIVQTL